jgi:hypothetical protein
MKFLHSNVETGAALATQLKIKVCPTRKLDKVSAVVQILKRTSNQSGIQVEHLLQCFMLYRSFEVTLTPGMPPTYIVEL